MANERDEMGLRAKAVYRSGVIDFVVDCPHCHEGDYRRVDARVESILLLLRRADRSVSATRIYHQPEGAKMNGDTKEIRERIKGT